MVNVWIHTSSYMIFYYLDLLFSMEVNPALLSQFVLFNAQSSSFEAISTNHSYLLASGFFEKELSCISKADWRLIAITFSGKDEAARRDSKGSSFESHCSSNFVLKINSGRVNLTTFEDKYVVLIISC